MKIEIFVDYDNLQQTQKQSGVDSIICNILNQISTQLTNGIAKCEVRLYGGWYEGSSPTQSSQDLTVEIQNEFPKIQKVKSPAGICNISVSVEIAKSLLEDPQIHLLNTFRKKGRPANIRVEKPENIGCQIAECSLIIAKKLFEKGKCIVPTCSINCNGNSQLVYRSEQKLVDTMLTCDLIYSSRQVNDIIIIISSDDDFIPPIRSILGSKKTIVRVHPKQPAQLSNIAVAGKHLIEIGL